MQGRTKGSVPLKKLKVTKYTLLCAEKKFKATLFGTGSSPHFAFESHAD